MKKLMLAVSLTIMSSSSFALQKGAICATRLSDGRFDNSKYRCSFEPDPKKKYTYEEIYEKGYRVIHFEYIDTYASYFLFLETQK